MALIYGTLATAAIAMLIAAPVGIGAATFLAEIAPAWARTGGAFLIELLAAIPSVVYGLWGLQVFAPLVGGPGILPAGLILAVMIIPYITAVSYDVCRAVPRSQRECALALARPDGKRFARPSCLLPGRASLPPVSWRSAERSVKRWPLP